MKYEEIVKQCKEIQDLCVFNVRYTNNDDLINISTQKTVSKVNYKKLMKMNNNTYMKEINFQTSGTIENFKILEEISLNASKFSQETLTEKRSKRANKKHNFNNSTASTAEDRYLEEIDMYGYSERDFKSPLLASKLK